MISKIKKIFKDCIVNKCLIDIEQNFKIIAAVSGGADSVCMLLLLKDLFGADKVICAHFNHKIRGEEADRDELFTKSLAAKIGVQFECAEADVPAYAKSEGIGLEAAARKLRYDFLNLTATKYTGEIFIAVAHNKSDKVETILHNISRGTSIEGLKGISYKRKNIIRPLLDLSRKEIEFVCKYYNVMPVFDSTNADNKYKRNLIRNDVIPFLSDAFGDDFSEHILKLSESASADSLFLQKVTLEAFEKCCSVINKPFYKIAINRSLFNVLDDAIKNRLIRLALTKVCDDKKNCVFPEYTGIYSDMILRVCSFVNGNNSGKFIEIGSGVCCVSAYSNFYFSHKSVMTPKAAFDSKIEISEVARTDFMLDIHEFSTMEYFDGDMLEKLFGCDFIDKIKIIRGDVSDFSFSPFGMLGHKNVRKYLIDNRIGTFERAFIEFVVMDNCILWIPGVGRSNIAPIDKNTTRVIIIKHISETEET